MERGITISEEDKEKIINFGAFGYGAQKIADILMVGISNVEHEMENKDSLFYKLYKKGKETADYVIDLKLFQMAQGGDLKALQKFEFRKAKQHQNE